MASMDTLAVYGNNVVGWHTVSRARIIYLFIGSHRCCKRPLGMQWGAHLGRPHLGRFLCKLMGGGRTVLAVYRSKRNGEKLCREVSILYATSGG